MDASGDGTVATPMPPRTGAREDFDERVPRKQQHGPGKKLLVGNAG